MFALDVMESALGMTQTVLAIELLIFVCVNVVFYVIISITSLFAYKNPAKFPELKFMFT